MVFLNYTAMQMTAKIVYYGPGLCGKTTNLSWIHERTAPRSRGEMVSLETEADRTLFFDLLPLDVGVIGGLKVRLQLYTVPGQVFYNATRRLVLKGVDGVVFVADSQAPAAEPNEESLANLKQNLEELGLDPRSVPIVFQYNKRDLRNILPVPALQKSPPPTATGVPAAAAPPATPAAAATEATPPGAVKPLAVEFAEEDTDKLKVRPVRTRGSLDIGKELEKLRAITAESKMKTPTAVKDRDVDRLFRDLVTTGGETGQEVTRRASLDLPGHLLKGLTDLRIHLGFDRDGREEILRDAVRVTLVRTRRLNRLRLQLDLEMKAKE
jgi:signal recognition particle receptor subunit beta